MFKAIIKQTLFLFCILGFAVITEAQDSTYIKVHFLYGSRPLRKYKDVEAKWFGGMLGGHVGIETDSNKILNFLPEGSFHWLAKKTNRHSSYHLHSNRDFYAILGGNADGVKKLVVYIPVSVAQKHQLDSISSAYLLQTPYDYALIGMRCGAASYEILGQLGIVPAYSYKKTYLKILYPKKLRHILLQKALNNHWVIETAAGTTRRKWEQD